MCGEVEVSVGAENAEVVEVVSGTAVVSICILELAEVVEGSDLFKGDLPDDI